MSTYTGTGTIAGAPGGVLAGTVVAACRAALADAGAAVFADGELLSWLNEAIREYSQHLPRVGVARLAALAGTRRYALPGDALAVLAVEYPEGRDPAAWLPRVSYKSRRFHWAESYDFLPRRDLTAAPALLLSFDAAAGETLAVSLARPHATADTVHDALTVPA
jgi:hypothetical protein